MECSRMCHIICGCIAAGTVFFLFCFCHYQYVWVCVRAWGCVCAPSVWLILHLCRNMRPHKHTKYTQGESTAGSGSNTIICFSSSRSLELLCWRCACAKLCMHIYYTIWCFQLVHWTKIILCLHSLAKKNTLIMFCSVFVIRIPMTCVFVWSRFLYCQPPALFRFVRNALTYAVLSAKSVMGK